MSNKLKALTHQNSQNSGVIVSLMLSVMTLDVLQNALLSETTENYQKVFQAVRFQAVKAVKQTIHIHIQILNRVAQPNPLNSSPKDQHPFCKPQTTPTLD